jgi:hypothetical protein
MNDSQSIQKNGILKKKNIKKASGINLTMLILKKSINNDFIF